MRQPIACVGGRPRFARRVGPIVWLVAAAGCGPGESGAIKLDPGPPRPGSTDSVDASPDWTDWGLTLSRAVRGDDVDYARLMDDPHPLDRFLVHMSQIGPETTPAAFPDREHRLAYWINCYNAMIVRSIRELAATGSLTTSSGAGLETRFTFRIDDRLRNAAGVRAEAARLAGDDWRVRFALCNGRRTGPALGRRPFLGEMLDAQLDVAARNALASPRVVRIDHEWQRLPLWSGLWEIRDRLVRDYDERYHAKGATILDALLAWSDEARRQELNTAIGYRVVEMPPDDRINALAPTAATQPAAGMNLGL